MIGFHNYQSWLASTRGPLTGLLARTRIAVGLDDQLGGIDKREGIRQGPDMRYEDVDWDIRDNFEGKDKSLSQFLRWLHLLVITYIDSR